VRAEALNVQGIKYVASSTDCVLPGSAPLVLPPHDGMTDTSLLTLISYDAACEQQSSSGRSISDSSRSFSKLQVGFHGCLDVSARFLSALAG
jgi:hypothetical protein